jgi:iron complex outermembrane recepter protein
MKESTGREVRAESCRRLLPLLLAGTAILLPSVSSAQTAGGVEEVVVTARKRVERLQDVPISITVLSDQDVERVNATKLSDIRNIVPNMNINGGTGDFLNTISVRGISSTVRNAGFSSSFGIYVDGVYMGRPTNFNVELSDIERLEVLRGPQGTLFGRNTTIGAINLTTRKPTGKFGGFVEAELGNYDARIVRGSIEAPLTADISAKLTLANSTRDGFYRNIVNDERLEDLDRTSGRLQIRGRFGATEVNLSVDAVKVHENLFLGKDQTGMVVAGFQTGALQAPKPRDVAFDDASFEHKESVGTSLTIDHELSGGLGLTSISAFRHTRDKIREDEDRSATYFFRDVGQLKEAEGLFTQEVRLASATGGAVDWVAGAYYLHDTVDGQRLFQFGPFISLTNNRFGEVANLETNSYSVFGNVTYRVTDRLTLTGGLRYTYETESVHFDQKGGPILPNITVDDRRSDTAISATGSINYKPIDTINTYFTYSRGFKPGGFNADAVSNPNLAFKPEYISSYEVGAKLIVPSSKLAANIALFAYDYTDMQRNQRVVTSNAPGGNAIVIVTNAAAASARGGEFEITYDPIENLRLNASYGYAAARFDSFISSAGVDLSGRSLTGAPKWNANVGANYRFAVAGIGQGFADVLYTYRAKRVLGVDETNGQTYGSYGLWNAQLGLTSSNDRWRATLFGTNIFNKLYVNSAGSNAVFGTPTISYGEPRTFGVRLRVNF